MAISRMQEPRQLYGLGSLVKKAVRGVKKIVKSPIGKAALLGGLGMYGRSLVQILQAE
jgi:glycerate kinase